MKGNTDIARDWSMKMGLEDSILVNRIVDVLDRLEDEKLLGVINVLPEFRHQEFMNAGGVPYTRPSSSRSGARFICLNPYTDMPVKIILNAGVLIGSGEVMKARAAFSAFDFLAEGVKELSWVPDLLISESEIEDFILMTIDANSREAAKQYIECILPELERLREKNIVDMMTNRQKPRNYYGS